MLRLLKYLILFILGYKVIKELFKQPKEKNSVPPAPHNPHIRATANNGNPSTDKKFGDAELIDYEEVK
jgi:hypothetical protein